MNVLIPNVVMEKIREQEDLNSIKLEIEFIKTYPPLYFMWVYPEDVCQIIAYGSCDFYLFLKEIKQKNLNWSQWQQEVGQMKNIVEAILQQMKEKNKEQQMFQIGDHTLEISLDTHKQTIINDLISVV